MKKCLSSILLFLVVGSLPASSAVIFFDLIGKGGVGLLASNQNTAISGTPGSGGELGSGITYDDVTNTLTINVGWGVTNGFTSLTGTANAGHIHGPTPSGGVASYTQDVGVLFNLDSGPTWNPSATAGGITNRTLSLTEPQEVDLLAGKYYLNVHTDINGGGEIRGNLVVVPEPSTLLLGMAGIAMLPFIRRRARG